MWMLRARGVTWGMWCARRAVTSSGTTAGAMCAAAPPVASTGATPWSARWSPPASRARTRPTAARPGLILSLFFYCVCATPDSVI
jgi:hypothetical protein